MNYGLFSPAVRTIEGQRKPSHTQNNHPKQQLEIKLNHRELRLIDTLEKVRTKSASFSCIVKIEVNRVIYISTTNPVQFCQFSAFLSCVYKQHIYIFNTPEFVNIFCKEQLPQLGYYMTSLVLYRTPMISVKTSKTFRGMVY